MHITNGANNYNISLSSQKVTTNSASQKSFQSCLDASTENTTNTVHWSSIQTANGTELQVTHDLDNVLTDTDKNLLSKMGYPDSRISQLIGDSVMVDRLSGTLTGPVTHDYLFGSSLSGTKGVIGSYPPGTFSSSDISSISALF